MQSATRGRRARVKEGGVLGAGRRRGRVEVGSTRWEVNEPRRAARRQLRGLQVAKLPGAAPGTARLSARF